VLIFLLAFSGSDFRAQQKVKLVSSLLSSGLIFGNEAKEKSQSKASKLL